MKKLKRILAFAAALVLSALCVIPTFAASTSKGVYLQKNILGTKNFYHTTDFQITTSVGSGNISVHGFENNRTIVTCPPSSYEVSGIYVAKHGKCVTGESEDLCYIHPNLFGKNSAYITVWLYYSAFENNNAVLDPTTLDFYHSRNANTYFQYSGERIVNNVTYYVWYLYFNGTNDAHYVFSNIAAKFYTGFNLVDFELYFGLHYIDLPGLDSDDPHMATPASEGVWNVPFPEKHITTSEELYLMGEVEAVSKNYDSIYELGRADGYGNGKTDGYAEGDAAGYNRGKEDGYSEGYTQGHVDGSRESYYDGYSEGVNSGLAEGRKQGEEAGYNRGKEDGYDCGYRAGVDNSYNEIQKDFSQKIQQSTDDFSKIFNENSSKLRDRLQVGGNGTLTEGFLAGMWNGTTDFVQMILTGFTFSGLSLMNIVATFLGIMIAAFVIKMVKG